MGDKIIGLVGPSGVGKTSYALRLQKEYGFMLPWVVTTRQQRADDDERYVYTTEDVFNDMVGRNIFIEFDKYLDYYYGTVREDIESVMNNSLLPGVVLDLTPSGCLQVKNKIPNTIIVAILPDSKEWLFRRLRERNTQRLDEITKREGILNEYLQEIENMKCKKVYASYSPTSWGGTFKDIIKAVGICSK